MIELKLSLDIYSVNNIKQVMDVYHDYANIDIKYRSDEVILIFRNCKYEETRTIKEFENYLIGLENL